MLSTLKTTLRRAFRSIQRRGQYPLALPHAALLPDHFPLTQTQKQAMDAADGTTSLKEVARKAGLTCRALIELHEKGLLLFWPRPIANLPPAPAHHPHAIIVSPHPDDAALSCGGRLLGDQSALVVNVFSQTAWWRFATGAEDRSRIQQIRDTEEMLLSRLTGTPILALNLSEALLRGHSMDTVFSAIPDAADDHVATQIEAGIGALAVKHPLAHWFLPLGIGNHVDHRIVRDHGYATLGPIVKPTHIHFYEDLPYAAKEAATDRSACVPGLTLRQDLLDLDDRLAWKMELLRVYASQFRYQDLIAVRRYAKSIGAGDPAEAVWNIVK